MGGLLSKIKHWGRLGCNGHTHHVTKEQRERCQRIYVLKRKQFGTMPHGTNTTILNPAIQERHRVAAADTSAFSSFTDSPRDSCKFAPRNRTRQETWQSSWWSDDSKWNAWSSWSRDDWRETQSQSHFDSNLSSQFDKKAIGHERCKN